MPVTYLCTRCKARYDIPDAHAHRVGRCTACNGPLMASPRLPTQPGTEVLSLSDATPLGPAPSPLRPPIAAAPSLVLTLSDVGPPPLLGPKAPAAAPSQPARKPTPVGGPAAPRPLPRITSTTQHERNPAVYVGVGLAVVAVAVGIFLTVTLGRDKKKKSDTTIASASEEKKEQTGTGAATNPDTNTEAGNAPLTTQRLYRKLLTSTAFVVGAMDKGESMGTGTVIDDKKRWIITNYHVIDGARKVIVLFPELNADGDAITDPQHYLAHVERLRIPARVVWRDSRRDLAILEAERLPTSAVTVPQAAKSASPGERVLSIGNSGVARGAFWRLTTGEVRNLVPNRRTRLNNGQEVDATFLETTSPVNPGDSGGGVVNERCELVAVVSSFDPNSRGVSNFIDLTEVKASIAEFTRSNRK